MEKFNAVVGQSGGPTAAINATLSGVIRALKDSDVVNRLYGMKNGIEGLLRGDTVDLFSLFNDESDYKLLEQTPAAALGSCRLRLPEEEGEVFDKLFSYFKENNIRYFLYIGGNDSMDTVKKLDTAGKRRGSKVSFIGVPKTIDNDLVGTDHTPGFGSAAKYIATSMMEIYRDCAVYTKPAVTIVEVMGRNAGWLTASAALPRLFGSCSCDLCYLPEVAFNEDNFIEKLKALLKIKPNIIVAVSEGLVDSNGEFIGAKAQNGARDVFGHAYLSGTGKVLENLVKEKIGCKVRSVEINILQRCAAHLLSKCDISESVDIGLFAGKSCISGESGKMAVYCRRKSDDYVISLGLEVIDRVANESSLVPRNFINTAGDNVTDECLSYIAPLIQGEVNIIFENGLPKHFVI